MDLNREEAIDHFKSMYEILILKIQTGEHLNKQEVEVTTKLLEDQLNKVIGSVSRLPYGMIVRIDEDVA